MFTKIFTSLFLTLIAIGGFFVSVDVEMKDNSNSIWFNLEYSQNVYAIEWWWSTIQWGSQKENTKVKEMYNNIVAGLDIILWVLTIIVSPAVMLASWLMSPDWTSGDLFWLRWVMYKIWVTISNITYFIYAILLIFIALATIFGRENYMYNRMLPKLALWIILVPFTWWFVQFTISASTYITAHVLAIPHEAINSIAGNEWWWTIKSIPKDIEMTGENFWKSPVNCVDDRSKCIAPKDFLTQSSWIYGSMIVYAYGVFKIQEYGNITTKTDQIKVVTQIIHQSFIGAIMFLVFWILTIALIVMLLARAVMLWLYTIFSPFLTLELVMWDMMKKVSDDFSIKEFVWLAFIPAIIWLALSFGLIVVAAVQTQKPASNTSLWIEMDWPEWCTSTKILATEDWKWWCVVANIMGNPNNTITRSLTPIPNTTGELPTYISTNTLKLGGINFIFKWKATWADEWAKETSSLIWIIWWTGSFFGTIIVDIIALLFIWMAFMAAKSINKVVQKAADPFEKLWKYAISLPKYMPLPVPGGSIHGMWEGIRWLWQLPRRAAQEDFEASEFGQLVRASGNISTDAVGRIRELMKNDNTWKNGSAEQKRFMDLLRSEWVKYDGHGVLAEALKKIGEKKAGEEDRKAYFKTWWIDDASTKTFVEAIHSGRTDKKSNTELEKAFKAISKSGDSGSNSTTNNNSFNIKIAWDGKYTLEGSNFDIKTPKTNEEILKELKNNIQQLIPMSNEAIKKELKDMKLPDDKIDAFLKEIDLVIKNKSDDQNKPPAWTVPPT